MCVCSTAIKVDNLLTLLDPGCFLRLLCWKLEFLNERECLQSALNSNQLHPKIPICLVINFLARFANDSKEHLLFTGRNCGIRSCLDHSGVSAPSHSQDSQTLRRLD